MANVEWIEHRQREGSKEETPRSLKTNWPTEYAKQFARRTKRYSWLVVTRHKEPLEIRRFKNKIKAVEWLDRYDSENVCRIVQVCSEITAEEKANKIYRSSGAHKPLDIDERLEKEMNDRLDRENREQYKARLKAVEDSKERMKDKKLLRNFIRELSI